MDEYEGDEKEEDQVKNEDECQNFNVQDFDEDDSLNAKIEAMKEEVICKDVDAIKVGKNERKENENNILNDLMNILKSVGSDNNESSIIVAQELKYYIKMPNN